MIGGVKRIFFASAAALLLAANIIAPVGALSDAIKRHSVDYAANTSIGSLTFSNINFIDLSETTTQAFGLTGHITNSSDEAIKFTSVVTYYDSDSAIIAISTNTQRAPSGGSAYTQMSSVDDLEAGYGASDIYRYDLTIKTDEQEQTEIFEGEADRTPSQNPRYNTRDYVLDAYDVDVTVHENNTFDVVETITATFHANYKHGIIRDIPLRNTFVHNDGTTVKGRAKVSNVSVEGAQYTTSKEDSNFRVKIGSATEYVHGSKTYVIKYTYDFGEDKNLNYDEFYFNIIGTQWDTVIGNVSFSIHMPKEFDVAKLGFSSGTYLSKENKSVSYNVVGNDITGDYNGILGVGEGLTIRLTLDDGYFVDAESLVEFWEYLIYIIPIAGAVIAFILWMIYGNDDRIVDDMQYYPPEGMNSLDMAFAYKGKVTNNDAVSLLLHLANQGYIKIVETSHTTMSRGGFKIVKVKEYDGKDENEEKFMRGLFIGSSRRHSFKSLNEVVKRIDDGGTISKEELQKVVEDEEGLAETTASRLRYSFYRTLDKITAATNKKENRKKYFTNTSFASAIVIAFIIASILALILVPTAVNSDAEVGFLLIFILAFYVPFFAVGLAKGMPTVARFVWLSFTSVHFFIMVFGIVGEEGILSGDPFYNFGILTCLIGIAIQLFFLKFMPKRTAQGLELYGKIKGFKRFLETAEKDRLEHLMREKPSYAYDILPYAYVLGVSTKWMKKFEDLTAVQPPDWYEGTSTFSMHNFNTFVNHTMSSSASAMTASPSSSGSSGGFSGGGGGSSSSGGGSSGGGGGGGGGSSW